MNRIFLSFSEHTRELLDKVTELHKTLKDQSPAEAEANYLEGAKKLAMYGVDLFDVKGINGL